MNLKPKLSVTLATRNEEENIAHCLESIRNIAYEIVIFDEHSSDRTVEIAEQYGARIFDTDHNENFHITKQKANDKATGEWILQLDADERVSPELATEIEMITKLDNEGIKKYLMERSQKETAKTRLFLRHQELIERRNAKKQTFEEIAGFYLPRKNMFLGKPLMHGGVYPDGVIRLFKRGKGRLPADNVHEQMEIQGKIAWLYGDLHHYDSPTFARYLARANRYTDLTAKRFESEKASVSPIHLFYYAFIKPSIVFANLYIRHLGLLDGMRGFIWSLFSAMHYPLAYFKYYSNFRNASLAS